MSAVIEKFIVCNSCGTSFGVDNRDTTIAQHRKEAKKEGWIKIGSVSDYCPFCASNKPKKKFNN